MEKRKIGNRGSQKIAIMTFTIPDKLRDRASYFLGDDVVKDPNFWMIALHTGIEELVRQYRQIEEALMDYVVENGGSVIVGPAIVVDASKSTADLEDELPL
ncbi:hypothetical protein BOSEA31B_12941 [Hyphomicrobiales bacterium]|nr:hypothetical protein BOSEA31B_12941 [Hyphomicrobiales bacterium]CAH1698714.1 hypothetical protein BOSEA1005_11767 [Hyphomicrobiales bacterium]CAI0342360.1 hypothetical protein BO1005MUT1_180139 [Hyphomicrobiales bacterium]